MLFFSIKVKAPCHTFLPLTMISKRFVSTRAAGICGILAPIIGLGCIGLAILLSPWFSWTENYLSDLAGSPGDRPIYSAHGLSSLLFNCSLVLAGCLGICFGIGIKKSGMFDSNLGNIGLIFYLLDAGALIGIGIFPETTGTPHTFFSVVFFILVGFCLFFLGLAQLKSFEKKFGWFILALLIFGLISVPLFLTPKPLGSNAIAEIIPIISVSLFSIVFGYRLFIMFSEDR